MAFDNQCHRKLDAAIHSPITQSCSVIKRFGMELAKMKSDGEKQAKGARGPGV